MSREDFRADWSPTWGNDDEREYSDLYDDRYQADAPEFDDDRDFCQEHQCWKPYCTKGECQDCGRVKVLHTDPYDDEVRCSDCAESHPTGDPDAAAEKRQMGIE